eukprot:GHVP01055830.1.p1 GENE.GHVP01055830.1~~GHVP01055830.1.p1  ORF type:complete len:811 (+),score=155.86 GHVP01055830.1:1042-3474(+)
MSNPSKQVSLGKRFRSLFSSPPSSPNKLQSEKKPVVINGETQTPIDFSFFPDEDTLSSEAFRSIVGALSKSSGPIVIGLAGGKTPRNAYDMFNQLSPKHLTLDWNRVHIFLIDERYVPIDHPNSNTAMLKETMLKNTFMPQENLHFPDTSLPYEECIEDYSLRLEKLFHFCKPDIIIFGMGLDGHIASWFPPLSNEQINEALDNDKFACPTTTDKFEVSQRITVSLHVLKEASEKVFLLGNEEKLDVFEQIMSRPDDASQPLAHVLQSGFIRVLCTPPAEEEKVGLSIIIFGASGDLAKKKTYPALFHLFCQGMLPAKTNIVGYSRSKIPFEQFWTSNIEPYLRDIQSSHYSYCPVSALDNDLMICIGFLEKFKKICHYVAGSYTSDADMSKLNSTILTLEGSVTQNNRLFYLAIPPTMFGPVVKTAKSECWTGTGWNRVVVEKPFGRDAASSAQLSLEIQESLEEKEIYRIDHFLGKEMALNLTTLRFQNSVFSPLFHRFYVNCVRITFKENIGTQGRGGYFDNYGIIRDIMQNHLLQLLTLLAMDKPVTMNDDDVRNEKVKVLKQMPPIKMKNTVVGQYTASPDGSIPGYLEDEGVKKGSLTPTFAVCVAYVNSERWSGVPFILKAGKGLEERMAEIRIQLQPPPGSLAPDNIARNEMVIRIQPHEAVYVKILTKEPGLKKELLQTELNLTMQEKLSGHRIPEAYERLIYDVIQGDGQNFVRSDELASAWDVFSPLLDELEKSKIIPVPYKFGSRGPPEADELIANCGFKYTSGYNWSPPRVRSRSSSLALSKLEKEKEEEKEEKEKK